MHEHSYLGLHAWSKAMIERSGWIILSMVHGENDHVKAYVDKLSYLLKCIHAKIMYMKKHDDKSHHTHELEILHTEVEHIRNFFKNNIKVKASKKVKK
jgi:hypothetical protein